MVVGKNSPQKDLPDERVDLGSACIQNKHATDKAAMPGISKETHEAETTV